jgi:integrase/recombinase XerD
MERILRVDGKLSAATVQGYAGQSIMFFTRARGEGIPGYYAVNDAVITAYRRALVDAGYRERSINYKLKAVRAFYRQAVRAGEIAANPTDGMTYEKEEAFTADYKALTKKQVEILFRELSRDTTERGLQRYAVVMLLILTGTRATEACRLKFEDLVFEGNLTGLSYQDIKRRKSLNAVAVRVIRGKGGKTRTVEFSPAILDAILRYRTAAGIEGENLLYTVPQNSKQTRTPIDRYDMFHLVKSVCRKVLSIDAHPHTLRHTHATISLERGAELFDISQNLGHSSLDMTKRYLQRRGSVLKYWSGLTPAAAAI